MAHPQSRAERRNLKIKRGEHGNPKEVHVPPPKWLKEILKEHETRAELQAAAKGTYSAPADQL